MSKVILIIITEDLGELPAKIEESYIYVVATFFMDSLRAIRRFREAQRSSQSCCGSGTDNTINHTVDLM